MPKMKTNKSAKKRFKVTGTGKVVSRCAGLGHLLSGKSAKRKRILKQVKVLSAGDARKAKAMLGK